MLHWTYTLVLGAVSSSLIPGYLPKIALLLSTALVEIRFVTRFLSLEMQVFLKPAMAVELESLLL